MAKVTQLSDRPMGRLYYILEQHVEVLLLTPRPVQSDIIRHSKTQSSTICLRLG